MPDNAVNIMSSWTILWYQGYFGTQAVINSAIEILQKIDLIIIITLII